MTICPPSAAANGGISFEVDVKGVSIGADAAAENLATVFSVQGTDSLGVNAFSSGNVAVEFGVSPNGRLLVTATPKQMRGAFFFRVRMHADSDATVEGGTLGPVVDPETAIFSITFDANGGVGGMTRTALSGNSLGALPTVMRAGYTFDNWWTAMIGGSQVAASTVVTADKTYYAHWRKGEMPPDEAAAMYCVIDLSAGANAVSYPVTYLAVPPDGGFNTDEYKTNKLVLRRIEPGTFIMGDDQSDETHRVTLTKPFYCGLFEVTQRQYELVVGDRPSYFNNASYYATRPVERVSYNMIRGSSAGAGWPGSSAVDADSFIGKLRAKTGSVEFDLPTEAQWEYACRAGTTSIYNNGSSSETDLNLLGRYADNGGSSGDGMQNCAPSEGSAKVGSYQPNAWGLYDMHGNVWERCLDWHNNSLSYGLDPKGGSSGTHHVTRGGSWYHPAQSCRSATRQSSHPTGRTNRDGFRLVRTPKPVVIEPVITHNMVQLWEGGLCWADTNIGADKPWEYGYYFWWGDTLGYKRENDAWVASDGSLSNISFDTSYASTYGKSVTTLQDEGWITADGVLVPEHDAAHVHWGGGWRMPTEEELDDLSSKCNWTWTTINGVNGYEVRGNGAYASGSIFLPAAGYGDGTSLGYSGSNGYYWSSVPYSESYASRRLTFSSSGNNTLYARRGRGFLVRPVHSRPFTFVVTFNANGGVGGTTRTVRAGDSLSTLPTVTRENHTFLGWFTTVDGGMQVTASTAVTADMTYYAHWTVNVYMVKFDANGGTGTTTVSREYGTVLGSLPEPTRVGHTFSGWFTTPDGGTQVADSTVVTADTTYYAHWVVNNYTVKFDANGGTGTTTTSRPYGTVLGTVPETTREGYTFLGWFTTAGGGTQVTASTFVTADATYYAHWTEKNFTIKFNANRGTETTTVSRSYGAVLGPLPTPTREGYTLLGWFTAATGGAQVTASTVVTADRTYYAHWKAIMYCVIDLSAGANAESYPVTYLAEPPSGGFNKDEYKTTKLVLRLIGPGTFILGEDQTDETHRVTLTYPFYCGIFEVTQKQYELVKGTNPSYWSGNKRPVEQVSYDSAISFARKLLNRTGRDFDLPTEAQWEYACRAGTTTTYYWGNTLDRNYFSWHSQGTLWNTSSVGGHLPNAWGLYDMVDNVSEWCLDWNGHSPNNYWMPSDASYGTNPKGPESGSMRVVRGGNWDVDTNEFETWFASSARDGGFPSYEYDWVGFRLVLMAY